MATKEEIESAAALSFEQLIELLYGIEPYRRSAAAISLCRFVNEAADELLMQLSRENCLYTRIAICESLENGNIETARKMTKYLGYIGKNQHKVPPEKVSAKKSFPLPRDIMARSLGRMDASIFPVILEVLSGDNLAQILEGLDAFGYMVFYNPSLATTKNCQILLNLAERYKEDSLLLWKVILCLSAFPCMESKEFLLRFTHNQSIHGMEAQRSLRMLKRRSEV